MKYPGTIGSTFKLKLSENLFKRKDILETSTFSNLKLQVVKINRWNKQEKLLNKIKKKLGITKDNTITVKFLDM